MRMVLAIKSPTVLDNSSVGLELNFPDAGVDFEENSPQADNAESLLQIIWYFTV